MSQKHRGGLGEESFRCHKDCGQIEWELSYLGGLTLSSYASSDVVEWNVVV